MALALKGIVRRQVFSPPFALSPAAISKSSRCPQLQELRLARAWEGSPKFLRRANYDLLGEGFQWLRSDRKAGKFNLETRVLRFQQLCDLALRISFNPCDVPVKHRLDLRARAFVMNLNHARQQCERAKFLDKVLALSGLSHRPTRRTPAQVTKTNLSLSVVSSC